MKLTDILKGSSDDIHAAWETTTAAADFTALPAGQYVARVISGELANSKSGTPGYKITFRVIEGEHSGRQFWLDVWLTTQALPMAKRDLGKLGITSLEQLEKPLPAGIRCKVRLGLRKEDDGTTYNRVRSFEVLGIDDSEDPDFPPSPVPEPDPDADPADESEAVLPPATAEEEG